MVGLPIYAHLSRADAFTKRFNILFSLRKNTRMNIAYYSCVHQ